MDILGRETLKPWNIYHSIKSYLVAILMRLNEGDAANIQRVITLKNEQKALIRLGEEEDFEKVWEGYKNQPDQFYHYIPRITKEMVDIWYEVIDHSETIPINAFLWEDDDETDYIGNATLMFQGIEPKSHVCGLGIGVLTNYQHLGVGIALLEASIEVARDICRLKRFELEVVTENVKAINLYMKFGFTIEGKMEKSYKYKEDLLDSYLMALLFV